MIRIHVLTDINLDNQEDINECFNIEYSDLIEHVVDLKGCSNINIIDSKKLIAVSNRKLLQITLSDKDKLTWEEIFELIEKENIVKSCV
jgi:hypothetical protein